MYSYTLSSNKNDTLGICSELTKAVCGEQSWKLADNQVCQFAQYIGQLHGHSRLTVELLFSSFVAGQLLSANANRQAGAGFRSADMHDAEVLDLSQEVERASTFEEAPNCKRYIRSAPSSDMKQFLLEMVKKRYIHCWRRCDRVMPHSCVSRPDCDSSQSSRSRCRWPKSNI
jgi:hypothetical protein